MIHRLLINLSIVVVILFVTRPFAQCNSVDALTSASFRITGGEACSTHIDLNWTFRHDNGELTIEWGTTNNYGESKSIYSSNPVNIPDLTPNTEYFFHVYGFYRNRTYDYYSFSVSTAAGSPANEAPEITSAAAVTCTTGQTSTYTVTATDPDNDEITFTAENLPAWASFSSLVLTLAPVDESDDVTITLIASDGNGGLDTLNLSVEVSLSTSVITQQTTDQPVYFRIGDSRVSFVPTGNHSVTFSLHTLSGEAVLHQKIPVSAVGTFSVPAGIPSGVYLLRLSDETHAHVQTLNIRN